MKRMIVARGGKRGKTAGRGGKGQSARAGNKRRPEWRDIIKKLPKLRGRGVNSHKSIQYPRSIVNVGSIEEVFNAGDAVTPEILIAKFLVSKRSGVIPEVKLLGGGEITKAIMVSGCRVSESARIKIEKAGGKIVTRVDRATPQSLVPAKPAKVKVPKTEKPAGEVKIAKEVKAVKSEKAPKAEKKEKVVKKSEGETKK